MHLQHYNTRGVRRRFGPSTLLVVLCMLDTVALITSHGDEIRTGLGQQNCYSGIVLSVGSIMRVVSCNTPVVGSSYGRMFLM